MSVRPRTSREDGAVLLTTLLVMSIMASLAVMVMDDVRWATRRAIAADDAVQAGHYLDAAEDYALALVREKVGEGGKLNELLNAAEPFTFPIPDGAITVSLSDGSNCIAPDVVLAEGNGSQYLQNLFALAGVPEFEAQGLMLRVLDWQDPDNQPVPGGAEDGTYLGMTPPYRTADSPITELGELRAVQGMTPEFFRSVAPWMCVKTGVSGPGPNVNTLRPEQAALLAANMAQPSIERARSLLAERPQGGWDQGSFDALPQFEGDGAIVWNVPVVTEPQALRVDMRVDYRGARRYARLLVSPEATPQVLGRTTDPVLWRAESEETEE